MRWRASVKLRGMCGAVLRPAKRLARPPHHLLCLLGFVLVASEAISMGKRSVDEEAMGGRASV